MVSSGNLPTADINSHLHISMTGKLLSGKRASVLEHLIVPKRSVIFLLKHTSSLTIVVSLDLLITNQRFHRYAFTHEVTSTVGTGSVMPPLQVPYPDHNTPGRKRQPRLCG